MTATEGRTVLVLTHRPTLFDPVTWHRAADLGTDPAGADAGADEADSDRGTGAGGAAGMR